MGMIISRVTAMLWKDGSITISLTDNQIIAAVIAFGMSLFMWIIGWASQAASAQLAEVLQFLSLVDHMQRDIPSGFC